MPGLAFLPAMIRDKIQRAVLRWRLRKERNALEPLLVLAQGRSGTTLLMQVLATSPQIAFDRIYPFEVRYLTYLLHWASLLGQASQPQSDWTPFAPPGTRLGPLPFAETKLWDGQEMWRRCFRAAWREFSQIAVARMGMEMKRLWNPEVPVLYYAEKVPNWLPERLRPVMSYKVIILTRDPRDVFLSVIAFDKKRGFPGFGRLPDEDDWAWARRFVEYYKVDFRFMQKAQAAPSSYLLQYEQLTVNLEAEAKRLSQWLGVEFDVERVKADLPNFAHHLTSASPDQSVERWRREMSPELRQFFQNALGEELRHYGYDA